MRAKRPAIHVGAGDLELGGHLARLGGHVLAAPRALEAVADHRVADRRIAHAQPEARAGSRYGACDIDSMPPATPTSRSPARIAVSSSATARIPDAQTLLIVSELTSIGIPARTCAWREGIIPCPAWMTVPITRCSTRSGATSERSSAASIAVAAELDRAERRETATELADRRSRAAENYAAWHLRAPPSSLGGWL